MRFSAWPSLSHPWNEIVALSRHAEQAGYDGLYFADHFMGQSDPLSPSFECFSAIAAVGALVPRVRLGSLVAGNTYRHPAVLAHQIKTIDHVTGGRVVLGLGAGWQQNEHESLGIELLPPRQRLDRFEEACAIVKSMFANEFTTRAGEYYDVTDMTLEPRPVQRPIPLLVGGGGEKRTMRIAATYADEWNYWGTPDIVGHKLEVLDDHCAAIGRDPKEIVRSTQVMLFMSNDQSWLDANRTRLENTIVGANRRGIDSAMVGTPDEVLETVARYVDLGISELIIPDMSFGDLDDRKRNYDAFRELVIERL